MDYDENYEIFTFVDRGMERMMAKWGIRTNFGRLASKANEMIKEYFEYSLNHKISRLFSEFYQKYIKNFVFELGVKPETRDKTVKEKRTQDHKEIAENRSTQ